MAAQTPLQSDDPSLGLALAMVRASPTPLLLLDGRGTVIAASPSFGLAFEIEPAEAAGRPLFALGDGEWDVAQLHSLVEATAFGDAMVDAYEFELRPAHRPVRKLVLNVRKLAYGDPQEVRLIVAVSDVTEARALAARDHALAHDNALLLKEARHRIANSLQIIASVMMLNARRTSSDETRSHLRDAHNRVMSVAELQQQLVVSVEGDVAIRPYLTRLCQTITASMVADPEALSIVVTAPDISIDPEVSVSLGLIVTELVINALKHGFPEGAGGRIDVIYAADDPDWTLTVNDDGVGMPKGSILPVPGLGTSIVQALASQLGARVAMPPTSSGTSVSIRHAAAGSAEPDADRAAPQLAV